MEEAPEPEKVRNCIQWVMVSLAGFSVLSFAGLFWIFSAHASTPPRYRARWYIKLESIWCADVTRKLMSKDEYWSEHAWHCWLWTGMNMDRCSYRYWIWIYIYILMYLHLQAIFKTRKACWSWSSIYIVWIISPTLRCIPESSPVCSSCGWWSCLAGIWARAFWWRGGGSWWSGGQTHRGCCDSQKVLSFKILSASFRSWAYWAFWSCLYFRGYAWDVICSQKSHPKDFSTFTRERLLSALDSLLWPVQEPHEHVDVVDEGAPDSPAAPVNSSIEVTGLTGWTGWIGDMLD